ncbi:hypothetical protein N431DRAFT_355973 [Stipitochalara longipes BDJ]|nr:hypothetical protein N431DRAFT_355973 [Stipitochalara longipes BDJ]
MVVIIALIWIFLFRVKSGIASNPWSIANCASLVSGELEYTLRPMRTRTKDRYMDNSQIINQLKGKSFGLRHYTRRDGQLGYGIIVMEDSDSGGSDKSLRKVERPGSTQSRLPCKQSRITQCFERQSLWDHGVRGILLAMLCGLLILILYYDMRQMTLEDPFENFMDGQKFGVRFFFVALGVIITLFWDSYFSRTTMMQPYLYLSRSHSQTKTVVSSLPATSVFIALWKAVVQRDPFALAIAFAGVLSKFTPILLSNIPFRSTQTWETHVVCAWFTVSILAFMILVLLWSFFIKWPHMPVDPSTIAGNMYYLCDSPILGDFKGRSVMEKKERDAQMERIQTRYGFGKIAGLSGELGIRVSSSKVEEP